MKKKLPNIVLLGIFSLITVVVWAASDLIRTFSKRPEIKVPDEILSPLDPTLDQNALNKIQSAIFFEDGQIPESLISPTASPSAIPTSTPTPEPTIEADPSAIPTLEPSPASDI